MATKTENAIKELKSVMNTGKLVVGTEETVKGIKDKSLSKVYLASNTPSDVVEDINYYANLSGVEVVRLDFPNEELGVVCQRPYYISVLGIKN